MTILASIAASMRTGAGLPISLSAQFNDITDPAGGGSTAGNTVSLSMGSGQTITYSVSLTGGSLQRSLNGGAFTATADGATQAVANGDTLAHSYTSAIAGNSGTVTLSVGAIVVGSFDVAGV